MGKWDCEQARVCKPPPRKCSDDRALRKTWKGVFCEAEFKWCNRRDVHLEKWHCTTCASLDTVAGSVMNACRPGVWARRLKRGPKNRGNCRMVLRRQVACSFPLRKWAETVNPGLAPDNRLVKCETRRESALYLRQCLLSGGARVF